MKDRGLILRIIPYSDSARIIRCLTEHHGVRPFIVRISKKAGSGHLQTGGFITFVAQQKESGLAPMKESQVDPVMRSLQLPPQAIPTWWLLLELLNKSLPEGFHIPHLWAGVDRYYSLLCHGAISESPMTTVCYMSYLLGLLDHTEVRMPHDTRCFADLEQLQLSPVRTQSSAKEVFDDLVHRYTEHFGIAQLESLELFH